MGGSIRRRLDERRVTAYLRRVAGPIQPEVRNAMSEAVPTSTLGFRGSDRRWLA